MTQEKKKELAGKEKNVALSLSSPKFPCWTATTVWTHFCLYNLIWLILLHVSAKTHSYTITSGSTLLGVVTMFPLSDC